MNPRLSLRRSRLSAALAALSLLLALAGCGEGEGGAAAAPPPAPPQAVSVVTVEPEALALVSELPGRVVPARIAEVRPRVSGILVERVFEQGSVVQEGEVLYRIDPEPFRVQVASAEAALQRAQATRLRARQQSERVNELVRRKVVSEQQQEQATAELAQAEADIAAAEAALAAARLDLEYADVKAPISGRIGRALITEGALVQVGGVEPLAVIRQLDPVYADFTQSVGDLLRLRRAAEAGELKAADADEVEVRLLLDDGTPYGETGRLLFSEAVVDSTTGQVTLRGLFPNTGGQLLPGMYVRILIEQAVKEDALAVPQQAVQRDTAGGAQLYVVKDDGTVELRTVRAGRVVGDRWIIDAGLQPGERVVVEGFQKIRPGAQVEAQAWRPPAAGAAELSRPGSPAAR